MTRTEYEKTTKNESKNWTKITYTREANRLLIKAHEQGWFCVWSSHDGCLLPDWWQRGQETVAAYHSGAESWISPDQKIIATIEFNF